MFEKRNWNFSNMAWPLSTGQMDDTSVGYIKCSKFVKGTKLNDHNRHKTIEFICSLVFTESIWKGNASSNSKTKYCCTFCYFVVRFVAVSSPLVLPCPFRNLLSKCSSIQQPLQGPFPFHCSEKSTRKSVKPIDICSKHGERFNKYISMNRTIYHNQLWLEHFFLNNWRISEWRWYKIMRKNTQNAKQQNGKSHSIIKKSGFMLIFPLYILQSHQIDGRNKHQFESGWTIGNWLQLNCMAKVQENLVHFRFSSLIGALETNKNEIQIIFFFKFCLLFGFPEFTRWNQKRVCAQRDWFRDIEEWYLKALKLNIKC